MASSTQISASFKTCLVLIDKRLIKAKGKARIDSFEHTRHMIGKSLDKIKPKSQKHY